MATVWAAALPSGDVCATGGYDALITCWRVSGAAANRPPQGGHLGHAHDRRCTADRELRRLRVD